MRPSNATKKRKRKRKGNKLPQTIRLLRGGQLVASPVLLDGNEVIPFVTNGEGGILVDTSVVSSPNPAGTNDTS